MNKKEMWNQSSKTDHKPDQFLSTLFTKVKDETDHKSDQFFSILSTHSDKPSDGTDQMTDGQGTPAEVFEMPGIEEKNPRVVQEKDTELSARSNPAESNSTESQETKDRERDLADELELTTEDESDNSHQRQTQKCFSCEEYSLLLP